MTRLRRADCAQPGFTRRRHGRGFVYLDEHRRSVRDAAALERVRGLMIPPAWQNVWICPHPNGHLQAVGTDAAGRRQYLYHPDWSVRRAQEKFDRMLGFARSLPELRTAVAESLARPALGKERVLACAVRLLDLGFFRVGGEEDRRRERDLRARHARKAPRPAARRRPTWSSTAWPNRASADCKGSSTHFVYETAAELKRRRGGGPAFLAYRNGAWVDVRSVEINEFIKELAGPDYSAKDFRTWHATVLAAVGLGISTHASSKTDKSARSPARPCRRSRGTWATRLPVCRSSYIDPRVVDRYVSGQTIARTLESLRWPVEPDAPATQGPIEEAVLELLGG